LTDSCSDTATSEAWETSQHAHPTSTTDADYSTATSTTADESANPPGTALQCKQPQYNNS